jgi:hypothetical protein
VKRKRTKFVIALLLLGPPAIFLYLKFQEVTLYTPLPNPNGYDQFVKAAEMLKGDASAFKEMNEQELVDLIAPNAEALALVDSALTNRCRVPIHNANTYAQNQNFVWIGTQNLAAFLTAKGRLAELQNHPAEAAGDYLEVIHFGTECGRGGLMLDAIVGIKAEGMAQEPLERLLNRLDAESCRTTASTLLSLDASRQNFDNVFDREQLFHGRQVPGFGSFQIPMTSFISWIKSLVDLRKTTTEMRKATGEAFREKQYEDRILAIRFSARAYELEKGKLPSNIHDLVPGYLNSVPRDPDTGMEMVYPPR